MPLEEEVRLVLVAHRPADLRLGDEHERRRERVARLREQHLVEVGERDDQANVVLRDERGKRRDVAGAVDARDERQVVGVVERGRHRVGVGGDGRRTGPAEGRDDIHALPGAGEEDGGHGRKRVLPAQYVQSKSAWRCVGEGGRSQR